MMKSKLFVLVLIVALMTVGLFMACRPGCVGNGTCKLEIKDGKWDGGYCSDLECGVYKNASKGEGGECDC
jgi:hypothetical protein